MRKKITIDLTEDQIAAIRKEFFTDMLELSINGTPGALLAQPWPNRGTMEITLMLPGERRAIYEILNPDSLL